MWVCMILIALGRVHTFVPDTDPDVQTTDLTPDITESTENLLTTTFHSLDSTGQAESAEEDFPYMAAVLHINECLLGAGAIVGTKWILVTAFQMGAFKAEQMKVRVGSKDALSGGQLLYVQEVFPHPMFKQFNNDVALLKTAEDIQPSVTVKVISMATVSPEMGASAALITWNNESRIQSNQGDILPPSECRVFYADFELTDSNICVVMDHVLPYRVTLYGSPLVFNSTLIGHYMGVEANTFKPSLCSSLAPISKWVELMMTNETQTQMLFPLT